MNARRPAGGLLCIVVMTVFACHPVRAAVSPWIGGSPIEWSHFSLPQSARVVALLERRVDDEGRYEVVGRYELTVAEDWVQSRYWLSHGGAGDRLETYVLADADLSVDYDPGSRQVFFRDTFMRAGSAFFGSGFTPFDVARTIIRSDRLGRIREVQSTNGGVSVHYFRADYPTEAIETQVDLDSSNRIIRLRVVRTEDDHVVSRIAFDDYEDLGSGEWFPRTIHQHTAGEPELSLRWTITELESARRIEKPQLPSFPEGTRYFDGASQQEVDKEGNVLPTGSAGSSAKRTPAWSASTVFASVGIAFLLAAAWIYRRRSMA